MDGVEEVKDGVWREEVGREYERDGWLGSGERGDGPAGFEDEEGEGREEEAEDEEGGAEELEGEG